MPAAGMCNMLTFGCWMGWCSLCEVSKIICCGSTILVKRHSKLNKTSFSLCRNREIRQMRKCMKDGNPFGFLSHDIHDLEHSNQVKLPGVTVVMPLKGFGEHNLHNWRTQVPYKCNSFTLQCRFSIYLDTKIYVSSSECFYCVHVPHI